MAIMQGNILAAAGTIEYNSIEALPIADFGAEIFSFISLCLGRACQWWHCWQGRANIVDICPYQGALVTMPRSAFLTYDLDSLSEIELDDWDLQKVSCKNFLLYVCGW